jgi:hypothetical protein
MYQMVITYIPNGHKIHQHFPIQGPPKITQIGDFWYEKKPSGSPDLNRRKTLGTMLLKTMCLQTAAETAFDPSTLGPLHDLHNSQ